MRNFTFLFFIACLSLSAKAQTVDFTYTSANGVFCNPVNISFTQTVTGNPSAFFWNFGNGQTSYAANPSATYTTSGSFIVELTAFYSTTALKVSKTIVINSGITVALTADRNYICTAGPINFSATATGNISSYEWNFGDGSPVVQGPANQAHTFNTPGSYTVTVKATDNGGCMATDSLPVSLQALPVGGTISPVEGCIPAQVNFIATANSPIGSSVTAISYNFGDGTVSNVLSGVISHSYTATGTFNPTVTITTNEGCTSTFGYPVLNFGIPPTNLNAFPDKTIYCGSELPLFIAKATNANRYSWDFGDGTTAVVTDTITQHSYTSLGIKTVTVTPFFNGCAGAPATFTIEIIGVIASFDAANSCTNKNSFTFTNTSLGNITSAQWNFGDGSPVVNALSTTHTYSNSGSFTASLTITDAATNCSSTITQSIHTGGSTLTNPDSSICRNSNTTFTVNNNQSNPNATYTWHIVGLDAGPASGKAFRLAATILGNYTDNYVIISNGPLYCPDTVFLNHPIIVRGPDLDFSIDTVICQNFADSIQNNSAPFNQQDSVIRWYWNYGFSPQNDTTDQPAPLRFPGQGIYAVKLFATDNKGCTDSLEKMVKVNPVPFIRVTPGIDTLCAGQPDTLIAFYSDTLLWSSTASLPCVSCDTIIVNPTANTLYVATARNQFGCSINDTADIKVYAAFTAQAVATPVFVCAEDSVRINVDPPGKIISWSPATGLSASNIYNPLVYPATNITYTANLSDSAGCFTSTADVVVNVKSLPAVNAGPDRTYPYNTVFTITPIYGGTISNYVWSPATSLSCTNCANPGGTALEGITYTIQVTSDSGCIAKDTISIFVECKYSNLLMPSAFTPNNDANNDRYFPIARGITTIKRFLIFNRLGQLLFEVKNFRPNDSSAGWDGRYMGQEQSPGAYVYLLEAVCDQGGIITKKESFLLIR